MDIRLYSVIYELTEDLTKSLEGMLEPDTKEEELGVAEVRQVFKVSKVGMVAGCLATEGTIQRSAEPRGLRCRLKLDPGAAKGVGPTRAG